MRTPKTWQHQWERVLRWHERLAEMTAGKPHTCPTARLEDDALAFFQNCSHLKDWLKNDPAARVTDAEVHRYVDGHADLKLCRHLCNGTKHLLHNNPDFGSKTILLTLDEGPRGNEPAIKITFTVETVSGQTIDAYTLATKCIALWTTFLRERNLLDGPPVSDGIPAEQVIDMLATAARLAPIGDAPSDGKTFSTVGGVKTPNPPNPD